MALVFNSTKKIPGFLEHKFICGFIAKNFPAGVVVADIGCGGCVGTKLINDFLPKAKIMGLDINRQSIETARQRIPNCSFLVADALNLPSGLLFDAVIACDIIEHFSANDQKVFLNQLFRVLKSGGVAFITTPDVNVLKMQGAAGLQEDHLKELTKKELIDLVIGANFNIAAVYGQGFVKKMTVIRGFLNFLKKLDIFKVRRFLSSNLVNAVDCKTQPIEVDFGVKLLSNKQEAAHIMVIGKKLA